MQQAITRLVVLAVLLLNQVLITLGWNPLPFSEDQIYEAVSSVATVIMAIYTWWVNNSVTKEAQEADAVLKAKKGLKQMATFIWPTDTLRVTSKMGSRWGGTHNGIDIAEPGYHPIYAVADGRVRRSYTSSSYGETIMIEHTINGMKWESVYAHLRKGSRTAFAGNRVKQGQRIGVMGNTGRSTGQHLHFELHKGGNWNLNKTNAVDPLKYLSKWTKITGDWTGQTIRKGQAGEPVKQLQTRLKNEGYLKQVDGYYGDGTEKAVRDYQSSRKLTVDGVAGKEVYDSLTTYTPPPFEEPDPDDLPTVRSFAKYPRLVEITKDTKAYNYSNLYDYNRTLKKGYEVKVYGETYGSWAGGGGVYFSKKNTKELNQTVVTGGLTRSNVDEMESYIRDNNLKGDIRFKGTGKNPHARVTIKGDDYEQFCKWLDSNDWWFKVE